MTEFRESRRSKLRGVVGTAVDEQMVVSDPACSPEAGREGCNLNRWRSLVASDITGNLRRDLFLCNLAHFVFLSLDCTKFF